MKKKRKPDASPNRAARSNPIEVVVVRSTEEVDLQAFVSRYVRAIVESQANAPTPASDDH